MKFVATDIDRREWKTLGRDRFERGHLCALHPVVVTGGTAHWAARSKWTPGALVPRRYSRETHIAVLPFVG